MSPQIDDRVIEVLSTDARKLEPEPDLATTVMARGRRIRRVRRIGTAVAMVACVAAAITVPGALLDSPEPDPVATPTPTPASSKPPVPLRVRATEAEAPYPPAAQIEKWLGTLEQGAAPRAVLSEDGYLYDGEHKVRLPSGRTTKVAWGLGRAPEGWFVATMTGRYTGRYGVLEESGSFRVFASGVLQGAALSPDGTQVAIAVIPSGGKPRASVVDLRTGRVVSATTIGPTTGIEGWNPSGIWLSSMPDPGMPSLLRARWIPGGPVQQLGRGAVPWSRSTDRMLSRSDHCEQVVTFGRTGFSTIAEYCGFGDGVGVLSSDGTVFVTPDQVARTIGSDRQVRLEVLPGLWLSETVWEDSRHVLIIVSLDKPKSAGNYTVVRCDVGSGDCERAYATSHVLGLAAR